MSGRGGARRRRGESQIDEERQRQHGKWKGRVSAKISWRNRSSRTTVSNSANEEHFKGRRKVLRGREGGRTREYKKQKGEEEDDR